MKEIGINGARNTAQKFGLTSVLALVIAVLLIGCETVTHGDESAVVAGVVGGIVAASSPARIERGISVDQRVSDCEIWKLPAHSKVRSLLVMSRY
jgi:hypothetical protein